MAAANRDDRIPSARSNPTVVSWDEFLQEAIRREIYFREQRGTGQRTGLTLQQSLWINWGSAARPPLSAEDVRIHAWLNERLALLHRERHGLWPRLRRFLKDNRLARWLGLQRFVQGSSFQPRRSHEGGKG